MSAQTQKDLMAVLAGQKYNFIILVAILFVVIYFRNSINYGDVKDVLGVLQNMSAAVFTIIGLWIGFLYPNAIASIVNDDVDYIKNTKDAPRIEKLIYVVIVSAFVMIFVLMVYLCKGLISHSEFFESHRSLIKILGAVMVYFMSWLQMKCVFSVIISNLSFANNLHTRISKAQLQHHDDKNPKS